MSRNVNSCTHKLRPPPPHPPGFGLVYEDAIGQPFVLYCCTFHSLYSTFCRNIFGSLKYCLVFGPYRPEKEICYFNKNGKFKFPIDLDRHDPRPLLNHRHLAEPPPFSLYTTFKLTIPGFLTTVFLYLVVTLAF
jgi:hypothetical protein